MKDDKEIFLPDTTVKYGTLKRVLKEVYGLELKEMNKSDKKLRKLEDGGTIDNQMENKLWDNINSGDYYDFEKGGNIINDWEYSIGGL